MGVDLEDERGIRELAERVLGSPERAREWLLAPNPALADQTPVEVIENAGGAERVTAVLTRIEYGVYE